MLSYFKKYGWAVALLVLLLPVACHEVEQPRTQTHKRHVMVMIAGGRNNLASYIREDMKTLGESTLPVGKYDAEDALLVLSRVNELGKSNNQPCLTALYHLYKDAEGNVHRDTLKTWGGFTPLFGETTLHDALLFVKEQFPSDSYGLVLSSHSSGWLPAEYYLDPTAYETSHPLDPETPVPARRLANVPKEVFPPIEDWPAVKSVGQDVDKDVALEMELQEFCEAIPYKMDYILMDACLNGCVEVAWALRDKADFVGLSPTEVLADGFDYTLLTSRLLQEKPDPEAVCRDYMAQYWDDSQTPWATITLVDTRELPALAQVCRELFETYREGLRVLDGHRVQPYFRFERHFFYDLRHMMEEVGATEEELSALDAALEACIPYKAVTEMFFSIPMQHCCGLSMYLPSMGSAVLDHHYKTSIDWNTATQLVK
ncbi:MAG: hypothetical protein J5669_07975 [Bacteroidales bacterium]|nr:hypothetical protein [Bacteroidales bacterium]